MYDFLDDEIRVSSHELVGLSIYAMNRVRVLVHSNGHVLSLVDDVLAKLNELFRETDSVPF